MVALFEKAITVVGEYVYVYKYNRIQSPDIKIWNVICSADPLVTALDPAEINPSASLQNRMDRSSTSAPVRGKMANPWAGVCDRT